MPVLAPANVSVEEASLNCGLSPAFATSHRWRFLGGLGGIVSRVFGRCAHTRLP
jgi:hypothetical protein